MPLPILGARLKLIDPGVLRRQNARMPVHCGPHLGHLLFNAGIYLCVIERSVADGLPTWKFGVWRTQERLNGAAREACVLLCPSRRAAPIGPISHRCLSGDCSICDAAVPSDFAPWCGLVGFLLTDRIDRSSKGANARSSHRSRRRSCSRFGYRTGAVQQTASCGTKFQRRVTLLRLDQPWNAVHLREA